MRVKFWGVRGSTPTPQAENSATEATPPALKCARATRFIIFDCGTGFRGCGRASEREFARPAGLAHVFVSHFHWDHIQGFPSFAPLYEIPAELFVFHSSSRMRNLKQVMEEQMSSPYFPVRLSEMKAQLQVSRHRGRTAAA